MENPRLCSILSNLQQRLSNDDRERLNLYQENEIPKPIRDDSTFGKTLKLIQSFFDRDQINEEDLSQLIDVLEQIRCFDAVHLLEEHQRRMRASGRNQLSQNLTSIMPCNIHQIPKNDEDDDPYITTDFAEYRVDYRSTTYKTNTISDGNNININEDKPIKLPRKKPYFCEPLFKNKFFVLSLILFSWILTLGMFVVVWIEGNNGRNNLKDDLRVISNSIAESRNQTNQTIEQLNDSLLKGQTAIQELNKTLAELNRQNDQRMNDFNNTLTELKRQSDTKLIDLKKQINQRIEDFNKILTECCKNNQTTDFTVRPIS